MNIILKKKQYSIVLVAFLSIILLSYFYFFKSNQQNTNQNDIRLEKKGNESGHLNQLIKDRKIINFCTNKEIIPYVEGSTEITCSLTSISGYSGLNLIVLDVFGGQKYLVRIFGFKIGTDVKSWSKTDDLILVFQEKFDYTYLATNHNLALGDWVNPYDSIDSKEYLLHFLNGNLTQFGFFHRDSNGYSIQWKPWI